MHVYVYVCAVNGFSKFKKNASNNEQKIANN